MVGAGIVEVDCAFDEPQSEQADIKVQVGLGSLDIAVT
jgi:hypothetical protein